MVSLLIDTDIFLYCYIQLIHMYKQLYTILCRVYAGGGRTIMFYAIEFYMFVCGVQHMNIYSCIHV